ncbi:MAG: hypothetical protein DDT20_00685 [Firmicutes bacterium]|nr:hypothetical protein [Bacillota bacterium]
MRTETYRVSIEVLENAFVVEVPDIEAREAKIAAAKKESKGKGGDSPSYVPYLGDCTKKLAAKSLKEVLLLVKGALEKIPEVEYASAFEDAGSK